MESCQDFRRDRRRSLSFCHAGREQARQRRLQALADGLPLPQSSENLLHLYGNGKDRTFSLADARRERDKAKELLKDGKDPSTEKQLDKHRQASARPFGQWADEWLAKKKVEKVKRGRIVAVRDPKTIEVLELRVGYIKDRFGKLCRQDIKRPDVLAFMRSYEAEGKLETRDRVRSIGEQICNYADVEGDGYNPFRNLNGQMIANISTPRPGVTEPRDVTRVFKLISAPWMRARFGDVVGLALRFDALTIPRPGMINEMEWSEVDWDAERWTIPAAKMKTGWDHVVPLSRQALAILRSVQKLTGHRRYAFSCSKDAPLSNNTLNRRLRLLGIDTKTDHCAHGFRTTFSTLSPTKRSRTPRHGMAMSSSCSSRISIIRLWKGSTRSTDRSR